MEKVLREFVNLDRMDGIHRAPIVRTCTPGEVDAESFANLLRQIYESEDGEHTFDWTAICEIAPSSTDEFTSALKYMKNRRGADGEGITARRHLNLVAVCRWHGGTSDTGNPIR